MKKFLMLLSILCCGAYADTINLHWLNEDGTIYQNSTCTVDSDLNIPTTPPTKYGYTFTGWKMTTYTTIEYIESTGTQWIDTGYTFLYSNHKTEISFSNIALHESRAPAVIGSDGGSSSRTGAIVLQTNGYLGLGIGGIAGSSSPYKIDNTNTKQTIIIDSNTSVFSLSGGSPEYLAINYNGVNISGRSEYLFNYHNDNNETTYTPKGKLYSCKLYDNDILVRDFIPVLDMNGTPCMFDKVEAKFYYNQGTGQFIAGPVLTE